MNTPKIERMPGLTDGEGRPMEWIIQLYHFTGAPISADQCPRFYTRTQARAELTRRIQTCEYCGEDCDSDGVCLMGCKRCAYCDRVVPVSGLGVPDAQQDRLWTQLSKDHAEQCEWILTRAHQLTEGSQS